MPVKRPESVNSWMTTFPAAARGLVADLTEKYQFRLKLTSPRKQRLGSFRAYRKGEIPLIRLNNDLEPSLHLLVFLHELAHLVVWQQYGRKVRPHGREWKEVYRQLAVPFLTAEIFPEEMIQDLKAFFTSPGATFYGKSGLQKIGIRRDDTRPSLTLHDIPDNEKFYLPDGREMIKLHLIRTRFKCYHPANRRYYLVPASIQIFKSSGKP